MPYGSADVARAPEGIVRTPEETITEAQRLLDAGLPFHAHEIFEDAWKTAGAPGDGTSGGSCATGAADRGLWKGLAQIAVGLTHLARGSNDRGAQTLLRRGAAAIDPYRQDRPYGLDIGSIVSWATALADQLDPVGGQRVGPADVSATGTAPALAAAADSAATTGPSRWTAPRLRLGDGSDAPVND